MENTCALHDCFCAQFAQTPLKVLECYSGIGGVHYALDRLPIKTKVTALDVNTNANEVLKFNFPNEIVLQRNILGLTSQEVDKMSVDLITMSPPCQPFTRFALRRVWSPIITFLDLIFTDKAFKKISKTTEATLLYTFSATSCQTCSVFHDLL